MRGSINASVTKLARPTPSCQPISALLRPFLLQFIRHVSVNTSILAGIRKEQKSSSTFGTKRGRNDRKPESRTNERPSSRMTERSSLRTSGVSSRRSAGDRDQSRDDRRPAAGGKFPSIRRRNARLAGDSPPDDKGDRYSKLSPQGRASKKDKFFPVENIAGLGKHSRKTPKSDHRDAVKLKRRQADREFFGAAGWEQRHGMRRPGETDRSERTTTRYEGGSARKNPSQLRRQARRTEQFGRTENGLAESENRMFSAIERPKMETINQTAASSRQRGQAHGDIEVRPRSLPGDRDPVSVPYTTAASQFLYGTSVVYAALKAKRRKLHKLYIYQGEDSERLAEDDKMNTLAKKMGVPVQWMTDANGLRVMDKMAQKRPHNGFVLEASALPIPRAKALSALHAESSASDVINVEHDYQTPEETALTSGRTLITNVGTASNHHPLFLLLSNVLDPGNLGAIIRSAYYLGASAIVLPERETAPISEVTLKASAGAAEYLPLLRVKDSKDFVRGCRDKGWHVFAADAPPAPWLRGKGQAPEKKPYLPAEQAGEELKRAPCLVMLGGEGDGLAPGLRGMATMLVGVPGLGDRNIVDSLNVSVAAGLVIRGFTRDITEQAEETKPRRKSMEGFNGQERRRPDRKIRQMAATA